MLIIILLALYSLLLVVLWVERPQAKSNAEKDVNSFFITLSIGIGVYLFLFLAVSVTLENAKKQIQQDKIEQKERVNRFKQRYTEDFNQFIQNLENDHNRFRNKSNENGSSSGE